MKFKQIFLILSLFFSFQSFATHIAGGYITYEFQAPDQYRFHLHLMRDCTGIPGLPTASLNVYSATVPSPTSIALTSNPSMSGSLPIGTCYIPGGVSSCNGGTSFGITEDVYSSIWMSLPPASDRIITYTTCCLNSGILNLSNTGNSNLFLPLAFDNLNNIPNNSPVLNPGNLPLYCVNTLTQVSFAASDPDGDSLVYELDEVYAGYSPTAGLYSIPFTPTYSISNPISSTIPVTLHPITGILEFTPNLNGSFQVGIKVKEYRNGVQIGTVYRSHRVVAINGLSNPSLIKTKVFMDTNNNQIQDAGETNLSFVNVSFDDGNIINTYYTDINGSLIITATNGTYVLKAQAPNANFLSVPDSNIVVISAQGQIDSSSVFGLISSGIPANDLMVSVAGQNPRPGFSRQYTLTAKNNGNTTMSGVASLQFDTTLIASGFNINPDSISAGYLAWNIASLQPLNYRSFTASLELDTSVSAGTFINFIGKIDPVAGDANPTDNIDTLQKIVVNSFDPNEKTVEPSGDLDVSFIQNKNWLNYTVYFQNTGTAPAINVRINDMIDQGLDLSTLEITGYSHAMTLENPVGQELIFRFNNINLADSNANEPASHGFISYRIKAQPNLWTGVEIRNTANIYFDFNPAIVTNTTINTITLSTGLTSTTYKNKEFIFPNPTDGLLNILSTNLYERAEIFDVTGRIKKSISDLDNLSSIDVSDLQPGFYIIRMAGINKNISLSFIKK